MLTSTESPQNLLCNVTLGGKLYLLQGNSQSDMKRICARDLVDDSDGAAMYAIVIITMFATTIGFFIGLMAFTKKKYEEWDKQAGNYLTSMYKRVHKEEKRKRKAKILQNPKVRYLSTLYQGQSAVFSNSRKAFVRPPPTLPNPIGWLSAESEVTKETKEEIV